LLWLGVSEFVGAGGSAGVLGAAGLADGAADDLVVVGFKVERSKVVVGAAVVGATVVDGFVVVTGAEIASSFVDDEEPIASTPTRTAATNTPPPIVPIFFQFGFLGVKGSPVMRPSPSTAGGGGKSEKASL